MNKGLILIRSRKLQIYNGNLPISIAHSIQKRHAIIHRFGLIIIGTQKSKNPSQGHVLSPKIPTHSFPSLLHHFVLAHNTAACLLLYLSGYGFDASVV